MPDNPPARGWAAIDHAIGAVYPHQQPLHYGTLISWALGGPDPIKGISAYKSDDGLHWHFVTYGFSELYDKAPENDSDISGFGFELTFRLACAPGDGEPPTWALNFLQNLGRYIFGSDNVFDAYHHMNLNGPIAADDETDLHAIAFWLDPQLGEIDTPNGQVKFLQVVGLCLDELDTIKDWNTARLLDILAEDNPLLVTDLRRQSLLADPAKLATIQQAIEHEGSSYSELFGSVVEWQESGDSLYLKVEARGVQDVLRLLKGRIPYKRAFYLTGDRMQVVFEPAEAPGWHTGHDTLVLQLTADNAADMRGALRARRGNYRFHWLPGLEIEVIPSQILGEDGSVIEVIG